MGAPIRRAMLIALGQKEGTFNPCQVDYRKDEKFWVFQNNKDVSVTFEVNFETVPDIELAKIFLRELNDLKAKQVPNCPAIAYHEK